MLQLAVVGTQFPNPGLRCGHCNSHHCRRSSGFKSDSRSVRMLTVDLRLVDGFSQYSSFLLNNKMTSLVISSKKS